MSRILIAIASLLLALPSLAATVSERSPFTQGHWWMPARAGTGFDLFNAAGQVAIVWYTYDASGKAIWYNAQGDQATMGTQSWPLWRQHWGGNGIDKTTVVGSVRVNVHNPEQIDLDWEVNGQRGTWSIQPFIASGVTSEIDHTGHWFNPANSGWGFTLTEQGDVFGSVLYAYDTSGEPTWVAGFNRGIAPRVELFAVTGACPSCAFISSTSRSVGFVTLDMKSETAITVHSSLAFPMAAGIAYDGASVMQLSRSASTRGADRRLASFDTDAALKAYLDAGMMSVPVSVSGVDFSPAPAAPAYSTTNLIEANVDEADLVKTDGKSLYTFAYDPIRGRQPAIKVARIDGGGASVQVLGNVALASGPATPLGNAGLYLANGRLTAVTGPNATTYNGWAPSNAWSRGSTYIEVLDASGALPVTRWRAQLDGYLVASRRIGERLYVVSRFVPNLNGFVYGGTSTANVASNQAIRGATPLAALLPQVSINGGAASPLVGTSEVFIPPQGSRAPIADMVVVTAIDLGAPRIAQAMVVLGSVDAVYASPTNLYVASSRQDLRAANGVLLPVEPPVTITDVHQVALGEQAMSIAASATLEGYLDASVDRGPFRLSEDLGKLRVVTSSRVMWGGMNQNRLTILEPSSLAPGVLKTVSYLPNPQRPETLGKPYEQLYATRFAGDRLYAVTFRSIDPLYIVDVGNAADPRIAGSITLPAFSEYLHPLANGMLLGFGKDAVPSSTTADGAFAWYQGLRLSLFDVRDATTLHEIQSVTMGKRGSDSVLL